MHEKATNEQKIIAALEKEIAQLKSERDILTAQRIRQEKISDNRRVLLKNIHQELQQEIRARTLAENALLQSRTNLQVICDVAEDFIFLKDSNRRIIYCNNAMRNYFGQAGVNPQGKKPEEVFSSTDSDTVRILEEQVLSGKTVSSEQTLEIGDNKIIIHIIKAPVRNERGEVTGICCISRDITDRKRIEEELRQSEAKLRAVCNAATDFIYMIDSNHKIVFANNSMQDLFFKKGPYPLMGLSAAEIFPSDLGQYILEQENSVLAGNIVKMEVSPPFSPPQMVFDIILVPIWDDLDQVVGICGIARDITERKLMEEELRKSNERLQGILDHSISVIYIKNLEGNFELVNPRLLEVTGHTEEYLIGRHARDTLPSEEFDRVEEEEREILKTGVGSTRERQLSEKCGARIYLTTKFPLFDAQGNITSICTIDTDITEAKQLEGEATRAAHLAGIGELAAGVAHEINNPINGVINYAQILFDELGEDDPKKNMAKRILHEGNRVAELVRNLLSFARNSKHNMGLVRLLDVIKDALNLVGGNLRSEHIEVDLNVPHDLPLVWGNFSSLQQILVNLLINAHHAIKHSGKGKPGVIQIEAYKLDGPESPKVLFSVQDSGIGIDEQILPQIFNPFFTTKPRGEGTGLGLYISYQLVQEHNGSISVDSSPGQGTTFTVVLPTTGGPTLKE